MTTPERRGARSLLVDVTPLKESTDFRWLYAGFLSSFLGRQLTIVAVPYQVFLLTNSSLAVGLLGLAQLIPLLVVSLIGGAIADAVDRRRLLLLSQSLLVVTALALAWNAAAPQPQVWILFVVSAVNAGLSAIDSPTRSAMVPSLVRKELVPASIALNQTMMNVAGAVGPALAGLLIARSSLALTYALEAATFVLAALMVMPIKHVTAVEDRRQMGVESIREGLRYLRGQKPIQGTMIIDLNAMIFGMPRALFPALGTTVFGGGAATVGFLYAAPGVGALIGAVTSGWVGRVTKQGKAVVWAVVAWGAAITLFGLTESLPIALVFLAIAGAADVISAVFRGTILQLTVPDRLRGRMSGVHLAVVAGGPRLGDLEAGLVAALTTPQFSVVSGGIACLIGAFVVQRKVPELWEYRAGGGVIEPAPA
jgi:MFS family permease